ncbi:hypothetical protein C8F04DRAFT_1238182 [Mycena alexandri]|uniref:Uncharacterized protein n=1 Tax=Mycena alexandri TaxID=1745969 RepID=A0AAD6SGT0_9AGAR|nr:hypothetical protein C8F04DRAFT_1238182 [Mycena alexandri]
MTVWLFAPLPGLEHSGTARESISTYVKTSVSSPVQERTLVAVSAVKTCAARLSCKTRPPPPMSFGVCQGSYRGGVRHTCGARGTQYAPDVWRWAGPVLIPLAAPAPKRAQRRHRGREAVWRGGAAQCAKHPWSPWRRARPGIARRRDVYRGVQRSGRGAQHRETRIGGRSWFRSRSPPAGAQSESSAANEAGMGLLREGGGVRRTHSARGTHHAPKLGNGVVAGLIPPPRPAHQLSEWRHRGRERVDGASEVPSLPGMRVSGVGTWRGVWRTCAMHLWRRLSRGERRRIAPRRGGASFVTARCPARKELPPPPARLGEHEGWSGESRQYAADDVYVCRMHACATEGRARKVLINKSTPLIDVDVDDGRLIAEAMKSPRLWWETMAKEHTSQDAWGVSAA